MTFFYSENEAKEVIADVIRPIFPNGDLFVAERNPVNALLREVIYFLKIKKDDEKEQELIGEFFEATCKHAEALQWQGTKMDFFNDMEHTYFGIRTVVQNSKNLKK